VPAPRVGSTLPSPLACFWACKLGPTTRGLSGVHTRRRQCTFYLPARVFLQLLVMADRCAEWLGKGARVFVTIPRLPKADFRRSAVDLCEKHRIRPRSRCIPRFHLPLKGCPWRLVVSEGHLDHRWGTLVSAGHLRVGLPKRLRSGSRAYVEPLHKPGGGSLARPGELSELAYGGGQGHGLHREELYEGKSEHRHYSFWTSRPSRPTTTTPGNRVRAGKQRAKATSTDAMWRLASARTTPLWMEPDEHAAVAASAVLVKRYFVPKPPAPHSPPDSECTPRRHGSAGPPHSPGPITAGCTALRRGRWTA